MRENEKPFNPSRAIVAGFLFMFLEDKAGTSNVVILKLNARAIPDGDFHWKAIDH